MAKPLRKIAISSYVLSFFVGEVCCGGEGGSSRNGSKRLEIAIFRRVFAIFLKMGVFSKRLAPLTRQTRKTPRTKRKTSKTRGNIEVFGFWGVLKKRSSIHYQNAPSPSKETSGSRKISIFLGVFAVFRSVRGVFLFVL